MTGDELIIAAQKEFEDADDPDNTFILHEEVQKLSTDDSEKFRRSSYSEALQMLYIRKVGV